MKPLKIIGGIFILFLLMGSCGGESKPRTEIRVSEAKIYSESYLKDRMKDPDSFQVIKSVVTGSDKDKTVTIRYRAKNGFGGYVIEVSTVRVFLKDGEIYNQILY